MKTIISLSAPKMHGSPSAGNISAKAKKLLSKKVSVEQVLVMLESQRFADFYNGDFDNFISGGDDTPDADSIVSDLYNLL